MNRYLVIADDFTGANDTGVQIRRRGIPVGVIFSGDMIEDDHNSYVVDTESRPFSAGDAYTAVRNKIQVINFDSFTHIIKKVDSTLRGSIGAEIAAIAAEVKPDIVLFAPALPDLGRTTEDAVHKLNGVPITMTEMARDPRTPVSQDNIQTILHEAFGKPVAHIKLDQIRAGQINFTDAGLFTADAVTNRDLQDIVRAALQTGKRILWVGTAGLADTLLSLEVRSLPALAVIASLSDVTNKQLHYAKAQGAKLVVIPLDKLLRDEVSCEEIAAEAINYLNDGHDTLLASGASVDRAGEFDKANQAGAAIGLSSDEISAFTQKSIGRIARNILERFRPSGVFLTGGDTAIAFFEAVESLGSLIQTEIAIGIPMMRLRGGPFDMLRVVTKAGAFGKEDAISFALRKLKEVEI